MAEEPLACWAQPAWTLAAWGQVAASFVAHAAAWLLASLLGENENQWLEYSLLLVLALRMWSWQRRWLQIQSSEVSNAGKEEQGSLHLRWSPPSLVQSQSGCLVLLAHWLGFEVELD